MDKYHKNILIKQAENNSPKNYFAERCLDLLDEIDRLEAENARLRKIEAAAQEIIAVVCAVNEVTTAMEVCELCPMGWDCDACPAIKLEDALKGGNK